MSDIFDPNVILNYEYHDITDADYRQTVHDLRMRVLDGGDLAPEEMFVLIDQIRQGRRAAGAPASRAKGGKKAAGTKGAKGAKGTKAAPKLAIDLDTVLP